MRRLNLRLRRGRRGGGDDRVMGGAQGAGGGVGGDEIFDEENFDDEEEEAFETAPTGRAGRSRRPSLSPKRKQTLRVDILFCVQAISGI